MGYMGNNLATVVSGIFAAVLTALWFLMAPVFPVLDFVFKMAVPIMWFLVFMCWIVQKGSDYSTKHNQKKIAKYTSDGKVVSK